MITTMRRRLFSTVIRAQTTARLSNASLFSTDSVATDSSMLRLSLASKSNDFPLAWLRDNCQCPKCYHPVSKARLSLLRDIPKDLTKTKATLEENKVKIRWEDGHLSQYSTAWLLERAFDKANAESRINKYQRSVKLWKAGDAEVMPRHSFQKVMSSDSALLNWLEDLDRTGLTLLQEMPEGDAESGAAGVLGRVGPARVTHYGTTFQVLDKGDPNNPAYTSSELALHTDLPYYEYAPGAQFLHCVVQHKGEGGQNQVQHCVSQIKLD